MGVLIANNAGSFNFDAAQVQIDLIFMALGDVDLGFNETPLLNREGFDCIQTTYTTLNESGNTPQRVFDLVNENGYTSPPDIIILGDDGSFVLADGTTTTAANGFAMNPGASGGVGSNTNPFANHVCTIYDISLCGGAGMWIDKVGGGTSPMTTASMLYHELSHCFRIITNAIPLDGGGNVDFTQEEINASVDENDMRSVEGLPDRDVNSRNGGCGGGTVSCCIIASLTTQSPFSSEVSKLRRVRDKVLRSSTIGNDFFDRLHYEYYAFSPEITRLLGNYPELKLVTKNNFVAPLLLCLDTFVHYVDFKGLGMMEFITNQLESEEKVSHDTIRQMNAIFNTINSSEFEEEKFRKTYSTLDGYQSIIKYINKEVLDHGILKWALFDSLHIWFDAAVQVLDGNIEYEAQLRQNMSNWISQFPISEVWNDLTKLELIAELENLGLYIIDSPGRAIFAERLKNHNITYLQQLTEWSKN